MDYVEVIKQREEMLQSYCDAIRKVGGCPKRFLGVGSERVLTTVTIQKCVLLRCVWVI